MNQSPHYNWTVPQRQATAGLLIILYKALVRIGRLIWPFVLVLFFRKGSGGIDTLEMLLIAIPVFILLSSVVEFFFFRFYIEQDELIIKKGFINKRTIAIPLAKIQAVHIEQHLLHRIADVAKVIIDTAGSEKAEAVIDAITVPRAESLKVFLMEEHRVFNEQVAVEKAPAQEQLLIRLSFRDLLKLGISANHIQAFFIVLAFVFSTAQNLKEALGETLLKNVEETSFRFFTNAIPLLVIFVLVLSVVVSMARILLNFYDFSLKETVQGYKLKTGLINTRQYLVRFSKIQFVSWEANWIRRKIGLFNLEFHQVAGEKVNHKQKAHVPITRPVFLERLLANYHLPVQPTAHSVHRVHAVYPFRRMLLMALVPVGAVLLFFGLVEWNNWILLTILWIPYVYFNALVFRKIFRLYVAPDALQVNTGIWGRKGRVLKWYKIQQVVVVQSIYQRHHDLASLKLVTAGGIIHIPYVTLELANLVRNYALYEMERSARAWL